MGCMPGLHADCIGQGMHHLKHRMLSRLPTVCHPVTVLVAGDAVVGIGGDMFRSL